MSEAAIGSVVGRFDRVGSAMTQAARALEEDSAAVQARIEGVLVQLQFQDRVSQILEAVRADMARLSAQVAVDEARLGGGRGPAPARSHPPRSPGRPPYRNGSWRGLRPLSGRLPTRPRQAGNG